MGRHDARRRLEAAAARLGCARPQAVALILQLAADGVYRLTTGRVLGAARPRLAQQRQATRAVGGGGRLAPRALAGRTWMRRPAHRDEAVAMLARCRTRSRAGGGGFVARSHPRRAHLDHLDAASRTPTAALAVARATAGAAVAVVAPGATFLGCAGAWRRRSSCWTGPAEAGAADRQPARMAWVLFARTLCPGPPGDIDAALADGEESFELRDRQDSSSSLLARDARMAVAEAAIRHAGGAGGAPVARRCGSRPSGARFFLDLLVPAWLALGAARGRGGRGGGAAAARRPPAALRARRRTAPRARCSRRRRPRRGVAPRAGCGSDRRRDRRAGRGRTRAARRPRARRRRRARAAVELLHHAAPAFDACGALRYRDAAELELAARHPASTAAPAPAGASDRLESLTERELQVARLIVDRRTNPRSPPSCSSPKTVERHIRNLFHKLDVSSRVDVARAVEREGRRAPGAAGSTLTPLPGCKHGPERAAPPARGRGRAPGVTRAGSGGS